MNKSTLGYARTLGGGASANITQYTGTDKTYSSLRWLFKPAAPGYYYILNQYIGNAIRPQTDVTLEDQVIEQEALGATSLTKNYLMWSGTPAAVATTA